MKSISLLVTVAGIAALSTPLIAQPFAGADSFNGAEKNTTLWAEDGILGNAGLVQAGGRVYHTVTPFPAGASDDIGFWYWNPKAASTNDWSVQIDVHVPLPMSPLGQSQRYGFGMAVTKTGAEPTAAYLSSLAIARHLAADSSAHEFVSEFLNAATGTYNVEYAPNGAPLVTVRIRWEAASQTLFSEYDSNGPIGGYEWALLRSVPDNAWAMAETDTFSLFITGLSHGLILTEGHELYADNFVASTGAQAPIEVALRFATELFWNSPENRMQQLQSSEDAEVWTNVGLPSLGNGQSSSVFDSSPMDPKKFYRVIVP